MIVEDPTRLASRTFHDHGLDARDGLPGAASLVVAPLLDGPRRRAVVVATTRSSVHLDVVAPRAGATGGTVTLVDATAIRTPDAVVCPGLPRERPTIGSVGSVGEGAVEVAALRTAVRRWWAPARPRLRHLGRTAAGASAVAATLAPDPDRLGPATAPIAAALRELPSPPAVDALLGLGPGLTPAGDDVLAGALVAGRAAGDPRLPALARAVERALDESGRAGRPRTTPVSAALLRHALAGRCVDPLADLLAALDAGDDPARALAALHRVGASSGHALALGALAVLVPTPGERP